jgi:hypothetical protein
MLAFSKYKYKSTVNIVIDFITAVLTPCFSISIVSVLETILEDFIPSSSHQSTQERPRGLHFLPMADTCLSLIKL